MIKWVRTSRLSIKRNLSQTTKIQCSYACGIDCDSPRAPCEKPLSTATSLCLHSVPVVRRQTELDLLRVRRVSPHVRMATEVDSGMYRNPNRDLFVNLGTHKRSDRSDERQTADPYAYPKQDWW